MWKKLFFFNFISNERKYKKAKKQKNIEKNEKKHAQQLSNIATYAGSNIQLELGATENVINSHRLNSFGRQYTQKKTNTNTNE